MRFKICRSSDFYITFNEIPPCKNAVIVEGQVMVREKVRYIPHWEVDINTLEELLELQKEVEHPLIVSYDDTLEIEIYDDWRE